MNAVDVLGAVVVLYGILGLAVLVWYLADVCAVLKEPADALEMAHVLLLWPLVLAVVLRLLCQARRAQEESRDDEE